MFKKNLFEVISYKEERAVVSMPDFNSSKCHLYYQPHFIKCYTRNWNLFNRYNGQKYVRVIVKILSYKYADIYHVIGNSECQFKVKGTGPVTCYFTSSNLWKMKSNRMLNIKCRYVLPITTLLCSLFAMQYLKFLLVRVPWIDNCSFGNPCN